MFAAIRSSQNHEPPIHRISQHDAMSSIPKANRVEKAFRIGIRELQSPALSRVTRFVNARLLALAAAEKIDNARVHRMHSAKIKLLSARNHSRVKRCAAIRSHQVRSARSAGPYNFRIRHAHPSQ